MEAYQKTFSQIQHELSVNDQGLSPKEALIRMQKYGKNEINKMFGKKTQMLCNYFLKFDFCTDAGILNYLNGVCISLDSNILF